MTPCTATVRAYLSAPDPEGVLLRCGRESGHAGDHEFRITWSDVAADSEKTIRDAIGRYLASRRNDPEFMRRLRERIEQDRDILDRLADPPSSVEQRAVAAGCCCGQISARLIVCPVHGVTR